MDQRTQSRRPLRALQLLLPLALVLLAACNAASFPQSTLHPQSEFTRDIDHIFRTTVWWALLVFVLVEGALLYIIFRFRGKPGDHEPAQIHGNTTVEIVWTVIPAVILAFIAVPTVKAIFKTYEAPTGADVLEVQVIGHQWWWEFRYPQYGLITANELHVPVGRTVTLKMTTKDVLHAFWLPQLAAKRDVFQQRATVLHFKAERAGGYTGQCAEFCGIQHGRMAFYVVAEDAPEFDAYIAKMKATGTPAAVPGAATSGVTTEALGAQDPATAAPQQPAPPANPLVAQGQQLFLTKACIGCHSLNAQQELGIGPNLAGIATRKYIAAGWLKNTDENLAHWIREPQKVKQGVLMQVPPMTEDEAKALVAYLRTR